MTLPNRTVLAIVLSLLVWGAFADPFVPSQPLGVTSVNGQNGAVTVQPGNFIGSFTVATLLATKPCDGVTVPFGSVAYVTDLGGGANNAKCINNAWQHFTLGIPTTNASTSGTVT